MEISGNTVLVYAFTTLNLMLLLSCFIQLAYGILTGYLIDMKEYDENALENQQPDVTRVEL